MKKLLVFLVFASFSLQAQYKIKGELNPPKNYNWVILYKIEGARQVFVKSETLKKASKISNGKKVAVSQFEFTLPANAKIGAYRVSYKTEGNGFADFLFNKEQIEFSFDPEKAEETIQFSKSKENKLYQEYIKVVSTQQYKTDSLQIAYLKNPQPKLASLYNVQLSKIATLQKQYIAKSTGLMVQNFIKATNRYNSKSIAKNPKEYLKSINDHFFDTIDFNNNALYNSAFIIDRITDYVFYMNYSDDATKQTELHKKAVAVVLEKATNETFKKDVIEFLMTQFVNSRNIDFADYMLKTYYLKLPSTVQNKEFLASFNEKTVVSIGRTAPEITWKENGDGKAYKLSTLNDAQNYVLVFWSTGCSHCLREIPVLYKHTQNKKKIKVIAFSLENNDKDWKKHIVKYPKWHNAIGLNKWENPIARTYQIFSTPTYIVLDKNKKIIAKPNTLEEVRKIVEYLEK
jgi:thiol-disulfide isomerase/thioredoxin